MSMSDLAARARTIRVAVIGGGVAGLVAALECAKVGLSVTVFEASDRLGGVVRSAEVDGIRVDVGAESFATRGGVVRALIEELGLGDAIVRPAAGRAWVAGLGGTATGGESDAAPLPTGGVLGIPANPWDPDVVRIIGRKGAWRAYLDRLRPPLTVGYDRSLGHLVRSRMGDLVLDRLVAPVTSGVYSARPDDIDVELAAPGLSAALTRAGSLSGAVGILRGASAASSAAGAAKAPGAAVEGLDGGMTRLIAALRDRLIALDVDIRLDAPVTSLTHAEDRWTLTVEREDAGEEDAGSAHAESAHAGSAHAGPAHVGSAQDDGDAHFDHVIVATPERAARDLIVPHVPGAEAQTTAGATEADSAPVVEIVTLVVDAPALDTHPRGTGVLTVPGSHLAKALTHSTAKWEWLAVAAGSAHVLRVSFGAQGEPPATEDLDDTAAAALALAEASALLGLAADDLQLRAAHRERFVQSQPASVLGRAERIARVRTAIQAVPGLTAVGAWLAGTGLAQVIPDAVAAADRVRGDALWGTSNGPA
jgi:oxygen-dependent protoporphyrinogen oxidase